MGAFVGELACHDAPVSRLAVGREPLEDVLLEPPRHGGGVAGAANRLHHQLKMHVLLDCAAFEARTEPRNPATVWLVFSHVT